MNFRALFYRCTIALCALFLVALIVSPILAQGLDAHRQGPNPQTARLIVKRFLDRYEKEFAPLEKAAQEASWKAETTGKPEYFDVEAKASLAMRSYLSDPKRYKEAEGLLKFKDLLTPQDARALEMVYRSYKMNQIPPDLLKKMVDLQSQTTKAFNTFRGKIDGKAYSQNELLEILDTSDDSDMRRKAWEAQKANGEHVAKLLIELVKARNAAARAVGYKNYWEMKLDSQDFKPEELVKLFKELDELTLEPFTKMKNDLDAELSKRFKVPASELMPWHYNNPFFQSAQPNEKIDLNEFYSSKPKEEIVEVARRFYTDINLPIEGVLKRSDLYEREGKSQHAFCTNIDRKGDVRTLCNIRPTAEWMDTMLHEQGHAVYDLGIDPSMHF
ncbi:MAG: M2 family metallopeptidase, partial [Planctomycetia bacterium]